MGSSVYLDHAATTRPDSAALEAYCAAARECWVNPSSPYSAAADAGRILRSSRRTLAGMLGADASQIVFTSGGTESNALALYQAAGKHVVISAAEHSSVPEAARRFGCSVTFVRPDRDGIVHPEDIEAAIRPDTAMISVQAANNETGAIQPFRQIGMLARKHRILYHCDAVQAFGQIPIDVCEDCIDLLSASAHKIYGPRGTGMLYFGQRINPNALIPGSQQFGIRGGTEDVPAIAGFAAAAELAEAHAAERNNHAAQLRQLLRSLLGENELLRFPADEAPRLPGILSAILPGMESEEAIMKLDARGILISGGAACATGSADGSHVLRAMGYTVQEARRALRISMGKDNTEEDIRRAAAAILELCR